MWVGFPTESLRNRKKVIWSMHIRRAVNLSLVSRFSVSFDCFWDVNISTSWRLKREPVIGWKFRAVFVGLLPIIREIQRFSSKGGQKCKLLCRLKNKGKRYSTLEAMLSKRQGKRRIKTCFHLFFNSLFLSRCCCARANHAIMFLKKFWKKGSSSLRYFTYFVDFWNLTKLLEDATLTLFV